MRSKNSFRKGASNMSYVVLTVVVGIGMIAWDILVDIVRGDN